jgi:hypothetical protein
MTGLRAHWMHWIADRAMVEWESGDQAGFLLPRGVPVLAAGSRCGDARLLLWQRLTTRKTLPSRD